CALITTTVELTLRYTSPTFCASAGTGPVKIQVSNSRAMRRASTPDLLFRGRPASDCRIRRGRPFGLRPGIIAPVDGNLWPDPAPLGGAAGVWLRPPPRRGDRGGSHAPRLLGRRRRDPRRLRRGRASVGRPRAGAGPLAQPPRGRS